MSAAVGPSGAAGPTNGWHQLWEGLRWYVREVSGGSAYDRYLARQRRDSPDEEPLDERTFWRQRTDGGDDKPPQRCC